MSQKRPLSSHIQQQEILFQQVRNSIKHEDFATYRRLVQRLTENQQISYLDCAAGLAMLYISKLQDTTLKQPIDNVVSPAQPDLKMVRYRLDVGHKNKVSVNIIKQVMVTETGVEKQLIGDVDIRSNHTLISLPQGMPADIFQHLKEVVINQQTLNIKRVRGSRRKPGKTKKIYQNRRNKSNAAINNAKRTAHSDIHAAVIKSPK